jgi:hypothetical protein
MARAAQPAAIADQITFELERFGAKGDRLELTGRWFGVRGRRFVRPTLTPIGSHELSRVLADLEHKPWAAEDGERWEAAFPWGQGGGAIKFELSVAPDITIQLPPPGGRSGRPRRLTALPRRPFLEPAWRPPERIETEEPETEARLPDVEEIPEAPPEVLPEVDEAQAELEATRGQLDSLRTELDVLSAELEATRRVLTDREQELEAAHGELAAIAASRDAASSDATNAVAELAEAERAVTELRSELTEARHALDQAAHERDEAVRGRDDAVRRRDDALAAHGAAMVMRRATRAAHHHDHPSSWLRSTLVVLAMLAVVFAILIVAHVL